MSKEAYHRYLTEFGARLEAAAPPTPRGRRGWVVGAVVVAAAIVALALFLAAPSGDKRINVVAEARAALPSSGELVHFKMVSTNSLVDADDAARQRFDEFAREHPRDYEPRYFEQWSADNRWRIATTAVVDPQEFAGEPYFPGFYISDQELQRIGLTHELDGPTQEAYDNGIDSLYIESLGVIVRSNLEEGGWKDEEVGSSPGGIYTGAPQGFLGSDPVTTIRKRLESGDLHDAGAAEVDGRSVRRLVSDDFEHDGFEYDVDAETFEPVRVRVFTNWVGGDPQAPPERMAQDADFEVFETLPLNSETEDLLKIDAPPATMVIDAQGPDEQTASRGTGGASRSEVLPLHGSGK
jgi:hypothetical protein